MKKILTTIFSVVIAFMAGSLPMQASAVSEFSVSPMNQKIVLTPGEQYRGTFEVVNPSTNKSDLYYSLEVEPYSVNENHEAIFENNGDYNQIVDWITLDNKAGIIKPNNSESIYFTINVPETAPAGGQYAVITVSDASESSGEGGGLNIHNVLSIAHIIYAEVTGETIHKGETLEIDMPSLLFSGNLSASSTVKNGGNVHSTATYTMQIFPLFSNEELYTNENTPETHTVMPERQLHNISYWDETPPIGIFNVIYTVEFEGVTTQISKLVIVCPIWLLFIIVFAIFALIFYFIAKSKARKKAAKNSQAR